MPKSQNTSNEALLAKLPSEVQALLREREEQVNNLREELEQYRRTHARTTRTPMTAAEILERARTRTTVRGRNRAAVELVRRDPEVKNVIAQVLRDCEGVEVDATHFEPSPALVQTIQRLYALPATAKIANRYGPRPRKEREQTPA